MAVLRPVLGALLCLTWSAASAAAPSPRQADPLEATAQVPGAAYTSAFDGYKTDRELKLGDWKQTNAAIAQQSGHAGHDMSKMRVDDKSADPHAGHDMGKMKSADPHAGHAMPGKDEKAKPADPHAGHQH